MSKDRFPKQAVASFINGFSGPKRYRDFRETGHRIGTLAECWNWQIHFQTGSVQILLSGKGVWGGGGGGVNNLFLVKFIITCK